MNRTRLLAMVVLVALACAAIAIAASSGPESEARTAAPPTAASIAAAPAPAAAPPTEGEALARVLSDLGAPQDTVAIATEGRDGDPSGFDAYDLVWIARARGTARAALLGAVAEVLSDRVAAAPDAEAMRAALRDTLAGRSDRLNVLTAREMFPATHAVDPALVMSMGFFADAVSSSGIVDFDWVSSLATAIGDADATPLAAALATRTEAPEVPLGLESTLHLDADRIAGASDQDIGMLLAAHADATEMHTPIEGLQPVMIALVAEMQILNGGFSQLRFNEPNIALSEVAAGYRAIGLPAVAEAVEREDDVTFWERVRADDAVHARAEYLRRLLAPAE